jgi:ferredoxin
MADSVTVVRGGERVTVSFDPGKHESLLECLRDAETEGMAGAVKSPVAIASPCGGRGKCGKCRVRVLSGASP